VKWFRKSAEQGNPFGQLSLGICYERGAGTLKDKVEAYAYYNLASVTNEPAREMLNELEKEMTPSQIEAGQKRSKELLESIEGRMIAAAKKSEKTKEIKANKQKDEDGSWGGIVSYVIAFCLVTAGSIYALYRFIKFIKSASHAQPLENKVSYFACWWKVTLVVLLLHGLVGYLNSGTQGMAVMLGRGIILSPLHALWIGWIWWRIKK